MRAVTIQTAAEAVLSPPSWFGEVAVVAHALRCQGVLATIEERVCFARRRCGHSARFRGQREQATVITEEGCGRQ